MKTVVKPGSLHSVGGNLVQHTPVVSTHGLYRDPALGIRGAQSQTVGSMKAMRGRSGTVEEMRTAAQSTDRFTKPWKG